MYWCFTSFICLLLLKINYYSLVVPLKHLKTLLLQIKEAHIEPLLIRKKSVTEGNISGSRVQINDEMIFQSSFSPCYFILIHVFLPCSLRSGTEITHLTLSWKKLVCNIKFANYMLAVHCNIEWSNLNPKQNENGRETPIHGKKKIMTELTIAKWIGLYFLRKENNSAFIARIFFSSDFSYYQLA